MLADQDYAQARTYIQSQKDIGYGSENSILYNLDLGLVLHYEGQYEKSNECLAKAEDRMEALYTKSVSREAAALLANENVTEYAGEKFERALAHVFHALNYVFLDQFDEALVEARRVESFLDEVNRTASAAQSYQDDAFVHYLCALLYEEAGKTDDARISFDAARKGYARYASQYGIPPPTFEFPAPLGRYGELVFLHYDGPAPRKIAKSNMVPNKKSRGLSPPRQDEPPAGIKRWADALSYTQAANAVRAGTGQIANVGGVVLSAILNISYPEYAQEKFGISSSAVQTDAGSVSTEVVEDVYAIASQDLPDRIAALKVRSVARSVLKLAGQAATHVEASGSEFADVRGCLSLPSRIRMARLKLNPGRHEVTVRFMDASGAVIATHLFQDVVIRPGKRTWLQFKTAQ
jgi:hypothetical protein